MSVSSYEALTDAAKDAGADDIRKGTDQAAGGDATALPAQTREQRPELIVEALARECNRKTARDGFDALNGIDRIILTVASVDHELSNGGFEQWFTNAEDWILACAVDALQRIGCERSAEITQQAIDALGLDVPLTSRGIASALSRENADRDTTLSVCNDVFYAAAEPLAAKLLAFIEDASASATHP